MQTVRNFLFYFSPLAGAVMAGIIGLSYNKFFWVFEVLFGFVGGCLLSIMMIIMSVRARFRSDPSLMKINLKDHSSEDSGPDPEDPGR